MQHLAGIAQSKRARASEPASAENSVCGQSNRFRRRHRLQKHEVVALLRDGARLNRAEFAIKLAGSSTGQGRIAIAVPKRIHKLAVDRNRIKRMIREAFRQNRVRVASVDMLVTLQTRATPPPSEGSNNRRRESQRMRDALTQLLDDVLRRFGAPAGTGG